MTQRPIEIVVAPRHEMAEWWIRKHHERFERKPSIVVRSEVLRGVPRDAQVLAYDPHNELRSEMLQELAMVKAIGVKVEWVNER